MSLIADNTWKVRVVCEQPGCGATDSAESWEKARAIRDLRQKFNWSIGKSGIWCRWHRTPKQRAVK